MQYIKASKWKIQTVNQLTGSSSPIRSFSNVDLPTPLGPTMATVTQQFENKLHGCTTPGG